jgi:hypothetical protein
MAHPHCWTEEIPQFFKGHDKEQVIMPKIQEVSEAN